MAGGGEFQPPGFGIDDEEQHGHELPAEGLRAELAIDLLQALAGIAIAGQRGADEQLRGRHQKGGGCRGQDPLHLRRPQPVPHQDGHDRIPTH